MCFFPISGVMKKSPSVIDFFPLLLSLYFYLLVFSFRGITRRDTLFSPRRVPLSSAQIIYPFSGAIFSPSFSFLSAIVDIFARQRPLLLVPSKVIDELPLVHPSSFFFRSRTFYFSSSLPEYISSSPKPPSPLLIELGNFQGSFSFRLFPAPLPLSPMEYSLLVLRKK